MNTLLFDTSEEVAKTKKKPRRDEPDALPATPAPATTVAVAAQPAIGTADDLFVCVDSRCKSGGFDVLAEDRGNWFIECIFCGTGQWVRKPRTTHQGESSQEVFRFLGGKHPGKTIDEVAAEPHGLDYIRWAAADHKRQAVKDACKTWLALNRPTE